MFDELTSIDLDAFGLEERDDLETGWDWLGEGELTQSGSSSNGCQKEVEELHDDELVEEEVGIELN